jgi:type IV pilus assembly protein PilM
MAFSLAQIISSFSVGGKTSVGINIGSSSVKMVELKRSGKSYTLTKFGVVPLPEDAVVNREVMNPVAVADAVKKLISQVKPNRKIVVTGIGGAAVILKRMTVEVANIKELQDAVFWEAEQYLPFDPAEVAMDFHTISRGKDNRTDVLFVASKLSILDGFVAAIRDGGITATIVDTEVFGLQNIYEENYSANSHESTALVDIGAASIKVVVVHDGVPVYTKDSNFGGRNLTAEIQKNLNLSFEDAEALKTNHSGATPQEVLELMMASAENFAMEIKRALDFYNASSSGAPVTSILLSGGSARLPDLSRVVEERLTLPTQILNPFGKVIVNQKSISPETLHAMGPMISVAMGFAMRGTV